MHEPPDEKMILQIDARSGPHIFFLFAVELYYVYMAEQDALYKKIENLRSKLYDVWRQNVNTAGPAQLINLSKGEFTIILTVIQTTVENLISDDAETYKKAAAMIFKDTVFESIIQPENWDKGFISFAQWIYDKVKENAAAERI